MNLRLGGVPEYFNLPILLAQEKGMFQEAGINLQWQEVSQGTGAMVKALSDSSLDAAIILTEGIVKAIYEGCPAKILQTYVKSPLGWGVHVPAQSDIKALHQVWDKPFAISRRGSGSHLMAIHMAMQQQIPPKSLTFEIVNNLKGAQEAFQHEKASIFLWEKYTTKPLVDAGEFRRIHLHPTPWPCFVVAVSEALLNQHPEKTNLLQSLLPKAVKEALSLPNFAQLIEQRYRLLATDVAEFLPKVQWATQVEQPTEVTKQVLEVFRTADVLATQTGNLDFFA